MIVGEGCKVTYVFRRADLVGILTELIDYLGVWELWIQLSSPPKPWHASHLWLVQPEIQQTYFWR